MSFVSVLATAEETKSFAVGHFSFGYILANTSTRITKTEINIPIVFALSVIPDIDIIVPYVEHRGPIHSLMALFTIFIPILIFYRKKAVPYFLALIQHPLVTDYVCGGKIQLLWPITTQHYGIEMSIKSLENISLEWMFFVVALAVMLKTRDAAKLLQPHNSNLILIVPTITVLLPTFLSFPLDVPFWLIPPHLIYLAIFSASIIIDLAAYKEAFNKVIWKPRLVQFVSF
ncbi:MAG: metal-dependent hydrolase [Candidatus Bathyarchaeia archaeon]